MLYKRTVLWGTKAELEGFVSRVKKFGWHLFCYSGEPGKGFIQKSDSLVSFWKIKHR